MGGGEMKEAKQFLSSLSTRKNLQTNWFSILSKKYPHLLINDLQCFRKGWANSFCSYSPTA